MASLPLLRPSLLHTVNPSSTTTTAPTFKPRPTLLRFSPLHPHPTVAAAASSRVRMSNSSTSPPAVERLISIAAYTIPFFKCLQYGRYLLSQYPNLALLYDPPIPFLSFYRSLPYASFIAFFPLYLGMVRIPSFPRFVRFNAMQVVTLDVLLVLPLLLHRIFTRGRVGLGFQIMVWSHNAIFIFSVLCFLYSAASSVLGCTPYLPFVADTASRKI